VRVHRFVSPPYSTVQRARIASHRLAFTPVSAARQHPLLVLFPTRTFHSWRLQCGIQDLAPQYQLAGLLNGCCVYSKTSVSIYLIGTTTASNPSVAFFRWTTFLFPHRIFASGLLQKRPSLQAVHRPVRVRYCTSICRQSIIHPRTTDFHSESHHQSKTPTVRYSGTSQIAIDGQHLAK